MAQNGGGFNRSMASHDLFTIDSTFPKMDASLIEAPHPRGGRRGYNTGRYAKMTSEADLPFAFKPGTKTMTAMTTADRIQSLGLVLPPVPAPIANFVSWRRSGQILYLSGQGPRDASGSVIKGKLGRNYSVDRGYADARQVGLQLLSTIQQAVGSLDHVEGVLKIFGMVNAEPDFHDHPKVINGCSDLLVEVLGDRGRHARSAVGMGSLPNGMSVEIEAIVEIVNGY